MKDFTISVWWIDPPAPYDHFESLWHVRAESHAAAIRLFNRGRAEEKERVCAEKPDEAVYIWSGGIFRYHMTHGAPPRAPEEGGVACVLK